MVGTKKDTEKARRKSSAPPKGAVPGRKGKKPSKYTPAQIRRNRIVALIIVVVLIVAMVFLIRWALGVFASWQSAQAKEAYAYQRRMEQREFPAPKACDDKSLRITLTHSSPIVNEGAGDNFLMTLENAGKTACTVTVRPDKAGVEIVSGNQIVFNSTKCQPPDVAEKGLPLLLDRKMKWHQTLSWDGKTQDANCAAPTQIAAAGTYRFKVVWEGVTRPEETVFAIQAPPPAPENEPNASQPAASPAAQPATP